MKVKIINGIYGMRTSANTVEPKTVNDAPFLVSDEEGARLIGLGVAKQVEEAETSQVAPVQLAESKSDVITTDKALQPESEMPKYSENMKLDDLKKVAIEAGASKAKVKKMRTKKEVIDAIESAAKKAQDKATSEAAPQISAADFE